MSADTKAQSLLFKPAAVIDKAGASILYLINEGQEIEFCRFGLQGTVMKFKSIEKLAKSVSIASCIEMNLT